MQLLNGINYTMEINPLSKTIKNAVILIKLQMFFVKYYYLVKIVVNISNILFL